MRNFVARDGVQHVHEVIFRNDNEGHLSLSCSKNESIHQLDRMCRNISYCGE